MSVAQVAVALSSAAQISAARVSARVCRDWGDPGLAQMPRCSSWRQRVPAELPPQRSSVRRQSSTRRDPGPLQRAGCVALRCVAPVVRGYGNQEWTSAPRRCTEWLDTPALPGPLQRAGCVALRCVALRQSCADIGTNSGLQHRRRCQERVVPCASAAAPAPSLTQPCAGIRLRPQGRFNVPVALHQSRAPRAARVGFSTAGVASSGLGPGLGSQPPRRV